MNFATILSILFVYQGLVLLKAAWHSRVPKGFALWGKDESGKIMRREQRLLFSFGGCLMLFIGLGALLKMKLHS